MPRWIGEAHGRWSALPRGERLAWSLALALPLLGALAPLPVRWIAPVTAVHVAIDHSWYGPDPWGRPLRQLHGWIRYSYGPDGVDDRLAGDDIPIDSHRTTLLVRALNHSVAVGWAAAAVVVWAILVARFARAPRRPLAVELRAVALQVALAAACWGGLLYWAMSSQGRPFRSRLHWLREASAALHGDLPAPPWLPPVTADAVAVALLWGLACLWLRAEPTRNAARARHLAPVALCAVAALGLTSWLLLDGRFHFAPDELLLSLLVAALVAAVAAAVQSWARPPAPPLPDVEEAAP